MWRSLAATPPRVVETGRARSAGRRGRRPRIPDRAQRLAHLVERGRVVDRGRGRVVLAVRDPPHRASQDLAGARLRQALADGGGLERGERPDSLADQLDDLADDLAGVALDAGLQDEEADRQLALQLVGYPDHGRLGDVAGRRQDLLDSAGREPVAGDVDDVVRPRHDEDVVVLVDVARVRGPVIARKGGEVDLAEAVLGVPERW